MPKLFGKLLLYAAMSLFIACGAHAHDIAEGSGVLCDKSVQIEMFAAYGAVKTINDDAHENVCVFVIYGHEVKVLRASGPTMQIVEVLLVQFKHQGAWTQIPPSIQYTLFEVQEEGA